MRILISIVCCVLGVVVAVDLPSYIPQCSLSDKHLSYCITEIANIVIPYVVQGDKEIGLPVRDPVYFAKTYIGGKILNISLTDAYSYDFKYLRITNGSFDLDKKTVSLDGDIDVLSGFADYSITNGTLLSRTFSGNGKFAITLVENKLRYDAELRTYEKDGEIYVHLFNVRLKLKTERAYFEFTGLRSHEKGSDINQFLRDNWQALFAGTKHTIELRIGAIIHSVLDALTKNVPLYKIFTH